MLATPGAAAAVHSATAASTSAARRAAISSMSPSASSPLGDEAGAERVDRIALVPLLELAVGAVGGGVGAGVPGVAVGLHLQQRGAVAGARPGGGGLHGGAGGVHVLAVDHLAGDPVGDGAVGDVR